MFYKFSVCGQAAKKVNTIKTEQQNHDFKPMTPETGSRISKKDKTTARSLRRREEAHASFPNRKCCDPQVFVYVKKDSNYYIAHSFLA